MTDYCIIDGKKYNVNIISIEESFSILYTENTGRTLGVGSPMTLDPLGTFYSHKISFKRNKDHYKDFDDLYDFCAVPRYDGFNIEIAHNQTTIKYKAYVSQGTRTLKRIDEKAHITQWGEFQANFVPIEAQVKPE
jgi:hypothetical protein